MLAAVALLVVLTAGQAAAQPVYRCTDEKGQPAFQQVPCKPGTGGAIEVAPINSFEPFPALVERVYRNASGAMTEADMLRELGHPAVTNTDIVNGVVTRQHVYRYADGGRRYVYTRDGEVWAAQVRPAPTPRATRPCYGSQAIENARTSASSIILSHEQRKAALERVADMENCRR